MAPFEWTSSLPLPLSRADKPGRPGFDPGFRTGSLLKYEGKSD